jgi:dCTP deaminase
MAQDEGVLSAEQIRVLLAEGAIAGAAAPAEGRIQPASLDLTLGRRCRRIRASFLPSPRRSVAERLSEGLLMHEFPLDHGAVLERGCVYLIELKERLKLPRDVAGRANPKSSTGRIDVFVRLVADRAAAFDEAPEGYAGPLYAEVSPRTFSILVREGSSLNQLRLKRGECRLSDSDLAALNARTRLIDGEADIAGGIGIRVSLKGPGVVGWRARRHAAVVDVDAEAALAADDYFEPIPAPASGFLILDPDEFYILASQEALAIPPDFAAEMTPIDPRLGEFRVHYAGFFDPGFGWSAEGRHPSRAVLEVRSHDAPFALEDGQLVARLAFERMARRPGRLYGEGDFSNYQGQGLKLSRHFR